MEPDLVFFRKTFSDLTDHDPFPWQEQLYERLFQGDVPAICDIPTGLGKTAIIACWLIALADRLRQQCLAALQMVYLPRRLIYIVNRRTIVDQATDEVEGYVKCIEGARTPELRAVRDALLLLAPDLHVLKQQDNEDKDAQAPLAVSTLRGAKADNRAWRQDPARAAVVVGTVDMIGSRLLFSGYRSSYKARPYEAGLIGQDALLVHDEAHLTPAFSELLKTISTEQARCGDARPLRVLELSATSRGHGQDPGKVVELTGKDLTNKLVRRRMHAAKTLGIRDLKKEDPAKCLASRAIALGKKRPGRIAVFVQSPKDAQRIKAEIEKEAREKLVLLTGTLRGYERDLLVKNQVFKKFLARPEREPLEDSIYLIATSAGEVGVNFDADHMICDLATLDSMIQRLGRVNRLGEGEATIEVWADEKGKDDVRLQKTREALERLPRQGEGHDASPAALRELRHVSEAFAQAPRLVPVSEVLLDKWSLTSIKEAMPGREPVGPYLHGVRETDPPDAYVAWRAEVSLLEDAEQLRRALGAAPLMQHELLHDRADRVAEELLKLVRRVQRLDSSLRCAIGGGDDWEFETIDEFFGDKDIKQIKDLIAYNTVVLPPEAGGLEHGVLQGGAADAGDVGDREEEGEDVKARRWRRLRVRLLPGESGGWQARALSRNADRVAEDLTSKGQGVEGVDAWLRRVQGGYRVAGLFKLPGQDEDAEVAGYLAIFLTPGRDLAEASSSAAKKEQELSTHLGATERWGLSIATRAGLPKDLIETVSLAGRWHDKGKDRVAWQRAICNPNPRNRPLAKTDHKRFLDSFCGGYRHEFGSLLDAARDPALQDRPDRDLILQLIGSHHGRCRPHFEEEHYDRESSPEDNEQAALEGLTRFAHLQRKHGRWGLAWLEALLHAADVFATNYPDEGGL